MAEWYAENYGEYATNRLAVDALEMPSDGVCVVDVGCGTGTALRHVSQRTEARLIGVDPVPRMLEIARERCEGYAIELREGSAEALPVEDGLADFVFAFDSYDNWRDQRRGLAEVRRILKPTTGIFVVVKDADVPQGDADAFRANLPEAGFVVTRETTVRTDDASFTLWLCKAESP
eukprot:CAMPEP_0118909906 /NCGR_PEP_ID=MMETSP1166-20130328/12278_1 /TAXON_ID=1104430 /ORGANISM="Chrysoreinhardia sp, Strain CCMP3193" /LENGTH=175 /DNA_ID=CAMNT_0006849359 /DNA_START=200 /DNA_END=730 /DNA_ORIENTATION=-